MGKNVNDTHRSDNGSNFGVVHVGHAGEQVVLDLVVEATVHEAQPRAPDVGRRGDLVVQEGLAFLAAATKEWVGLGEVSVFECVSA